MTIQMLVQADDPAAYGRLYRILRGQTTKTTVSNDTIATLWRLGSPEIRALVTEAAGADRLWAILRVAEDGVIPTSGSGTPVMPFTRLGLEGRRG